VGDIFREVDEELKQDRYEKLWRQYGKYVIAGAVLIVAAVAGWKAWESHQTSQRHAEGKKFAAAAALMQDGKASEASAAFSQLAADAGSGYGVLARFYQASIVAKGGDAAGAIGIYDSIADDGSVPTAMQELATVLGALQALRVPSIDAATIEKKVQPMTGAGRAYRHVALEVMALTAQRAGDMEKARTSYRAIVDDPASPPGIRARASQMLNILGAS
tara:strand:- start:21143 stop:21796 length:654 start_codon:yes stop_codon:yes gene_type:complete